MPNTVPDKYLELHRCSLNINDLSILGVFQLQNMLWKLYFLHARVFQISLKYCFMYQNWSHGTVFNVFRWDSHPYLCAPTSFIFTLIITLGRSDEFTVYLRRRCNLHADKYDPFARMSLPPNCGPPCLLPFHGAWRRECKGKERGRGKLNC